MIITQTRQRRTFVGSLNPGADLVDALANICVDNSILCALFSGIGYMKDPEIRSYDIDTRGFKPPVLHRGTFHCVSLHGNASLQDKRTVLRTHVIGTLTTGSNQPPQLLSGELAGAEVVAFEFTLSSIDDIRLYRAPDDRTGLDPWLHMSLGSGPVGADIEPDTIPVVGTGPAAEPPKPKVVAEPKRSAPSPAQEDDDDSDASPQLEVKAGDLLEHPTLGRCEVLDNDGDERVTIRLGSGRRVELHTGLLDLQDAGEVDGKRLIKVSIRRRR